MDDRNRIRDASVGVFSAVEGSEHIDERHTARCRYDVHQPLRVLLFAQVLRPARRRVRHDVFRHDVRRKIRIEVKRNIPVDEIPAQAVKIEGLPADHVRKVPVHVADGLILHRDAVAASSDLPRNIIRRVA